MNELLAFQFDNGTDHIGRKISDIWILDNFTLEHDHSYIQWLFPIDKSTKFNLHAPILSQSDRDRFKESPHLKANQQKSLARMSNFFGLDWTDGVFLAKPELHMRTHIWLKRGGHNHLRISRIIKSLALCDQVLIAERFLEAVLEYSVSHGAVNNQTRDHWVKALNYERHQP